RGPAVAVEGAGDDSFSVGGVDVEPDRRDEAAEEAEHRDARAERPPHWRRNEHRAKERHARRREQREDRREREPIDVWRLQAHLRGTTVTGCFGPFPTNEWPLTAAGHAERSKSPATSGAMSVSSTGRASIASSATVEPRASWRTAEMSRSMYI